MGRLAVAVKFDLDISVILPVMGWLLCIAAYIILPLPCNK